MDSNVLSSESSTALAQLHVEQKELLDTIDNLRKHGVGRLVDLPQIVVVGDQSSGKSSVLEAISCVRFPVQSGLCTRFATELVMRTEPQTRVDVCIQPAVPSSGQTTGGAEEFREVGHDTDDLPRIIEKAKETMLKADSGFSEDVLRIEVCGPQVPCLTLVDLPGFYHGQDEHQSASDRPVVDRLAARYIKQKNSIILAVVSARNQLILQKVLSEVKLHDQNRQRTLGIITKPDLLIPGSSEEDQFLKLARNQVKSQELNLGWHVLRNRGSTETEYTHEERNRKEEEFFQSTIWGALPSKKRGVETLRKKLSEVLLDHIRSNLPQLINSIEASMIDREKQLEQLGPPRRTPQEIRTHLGIIARKYERLCQDALNGNYGDEFFGSLSAAADNETATTQPRTQSRQSSTPPKLNDVHVRKLRALIRHLNRGFAWVLAKKGSQELILNDTDETVRTSTHNILGRHDEAPIVPAYLHGHLNAIYHLHDPRYVKLAVKAAEVERLSRDNQGIEFPGTPNDRIAVQLFREQVRPWKKLAGYHAKLVREAAQLFVETLMRHVCSADERTGTAILEGIVDEFFGERTRALEDKIVELTMHYQKGSPQPVEEVFVEMLGDRKNGEMGSQAEKIRMLNWLMKQHPEMLTEKGNKMVESEVKRLNREEKRAHTGGAEGLILKAETYYEMSLSIFTDNIIILAVENCLVSELPSILTTDKVSRMSDEELIHLASEPPGIQQDRDELGAQHEALRKGLQFCSRFRRRDTSANHSLSKPKDKNCDLPSDRHLFTPPAQRLPIAARAYSRTPSPSAPVRATPGNSQFRTGSPAPRKTLTPSSQESSPAQQDEEESPGSRRTTPSSDRDGPSLFNFGRGGIGAQQQQNVSSPFGGVVSLRKPTDPPGTALDGGAIQFSAIPTAS